MTPTPLDPAARVPGRGHYTRAAAADRLDWARRHTGADLPHLAAHGLDPEALRGNVENLIGAVQVPVGVAGPLLFCGEHARGAVLAPFATTEGALVASACRGARALSLAGGVATQVLDQQMGRAPVFRCRNEAGAVQLADWLEGQLIALREAIRPASLRADLVAVRPVVLGATVHARFLYRTADAAGQNMTTAATARACRWVEQHAPADAGLTGHVIEGNLSSDKKASRLSFADGRGTRVVARAHVPDGVLEDVLKVSRAALLQTWADFERGSAEAGMLGINVNVANAVAALFLATGQDVACVHESSVARLEIEDAGDGVRATLLLPALVVGTVGGGTGLPTQREALALMGCHDAETGGTGKAGRLAEIVAGFALALELSTLGAIAAGHFAAAHERLGRNRPGLGLQTADFGPELFEHLLAREGERVSIDHVTPLALDAADSILTDVAATELKAKRVGLFPFAVRYADKGGSQREARLVLKVKATDDEVIGALNKMAQGCGGALADAFEKLGPETDFAGCHLRELAVARLRAPAFSRIAPRVYGQVCEPARERFVLAMEHLDDVTHAGTADRPGAWDEEAIDAVLRGLAPFHALHLGRTDGLAERFFAAERTAARTVRLAPLWHALAEHGAREFPALYPPERARLAHALIDALPDWWPRLESLPRTLTHGDFNPRNLCLRRTPDGPALCAYDWELAAVHAPQADLAEFLAFVLPPDTPRAVRWGWVDRYRTLLEEAAGWPFDPDAFRAGFDLAAADLLVGRMGLYAMAHLYKDYAFFPRVLDGLFRWVEGSETLRPYVAGAACRVLA